MKNKNNKTSKIINKFKKIDKKFAASSSDLADAITRVGSTAKDVKVSFKSLIKNVKQAQKTTSRGGAVIGNALKTIFTRLGRDENLDKLQSLGIKVRYKNGNQLPANQILTEMAQKWPDMNTKDKKMIGENIAGVFQMEIFKAIIRN